MTRTCWFDGRLRSEAEATALWIERELGDGTWWGLDLRAPGGRVFAWPEHLQQLRAGAARCGVEIAATDADIMRGVVAAIATSGIVDVHVRLLLSERAAGEGWSPWSVLVRPLPPPSGVRHVRVVEAGDVQSIIASLGAGPRRRAWVRNGAIAHVDAHDALLLLERGRLTTSDLGSGAQDTVVRRLVLEFAEQRGWSVAETPVTPDLVRGAERVVVATSLELAVAMDRVDGRPLRGGEAAEFAADFAEHCDRLQRERYTPMLERLLG